MKNDDTSWIQEHLPGWNLIRYVVDDTYGPWLNSGDWWNTTVWSLQQWDLVARARDDTLLCCCLLHDLRQGSWKMVGLYD